MITEKWKPVNGVLAMMAFLRGPTGFEIDINKLLPTGVTQEALPLILFVGTHTTAQSGNLVAYGNIAVGWDSYNNYVNENGGIGGLDIELIVKDDAYVAAQTIEFIDELIESENVFMIVTLGSPNTLWWCTTL